MTPLEHAVVLLHFQSARAAHAIAALPARERALIERVDRRAFAADGERRARAASVIAEELPVSTACVGVRALFSFFDDAAFERVLRGDVGLVPAAAAWLVADARDFAVLEGAVAHARRRAQVRVPAGHVVLGARVALCEVGAGALDAFARARDNLGALPHEAVAHGARTVAPLKSPEREHVVVQDGALSRVSAALAAVLAAADPPAARERVEAAARAQGAEAAEAHDLVDDLAKEGLLAVG